MGESITFPSNGGVGQGYLAVPDGGSGPGVLVIQEWWGLVDHIKDVADRFAAEGFVALAPDLYNGETVSEPDDAAKAMMAMRLDDAATVMSGAVDELLRRSTGDGVGVIGFCMGGGLALVLACQRPDAVTVVVPCYGVIPWPDAQPDYTRLRARTVIHCAALDESFPPDAAEALGRQLAELGVDVEVIVHPGADHAFFNDDRPEVYDAAEAAQVWDSTLSEFRQRLG